jgi:hypothetical protein
MTWCPGIFLKSTDKSTNILSQHSSPPDRNLNPDIQNTKDEFYPLDRDIPSEENSKRVNIQGISKRALQL